MTPSSFATPSTLPFNAFPCFLFLLRTLNYDSMLKKNIAYISCYEVLIVFSKFTDILSRLRGRFITEVLFRQAVITVDCCNSSFVEVFYITVGQIFNKLWMDFKLTSFLPTCSPAFFEVDLPSDFEFL